MDVVLTRRDFLKTLAAVSLPLCVPVEILAETIVLQGPIIDMAVFEQACRIVLVGHGEAHASFDMGLALSAVTFTDQHRGIWSLETGGNAQDCGAMEITALVSGDRRIEV